MDIAFTAEIVIGALFAAALALICIRAWKLNVEFDLLLLRYQLFELRDDLSKLAVFGHVSEDAAEYIYVRNVTNVLLGNLQEFRFKNIVRAVITLTADDQEKYKKMLRKINQASKLAEIYASIMKLGWAAMYSNSAILRCLFMTVWVLSFFVQRFRFLRRSQSLRSCVNIGESLSVVQRRCQDAEVLLATA